VSDHFDGRRFVNPTGTAGPPFAEVWRMLREPRTPWPRRVDVRQQVPPALNGAAAVVTFIGHATFLIQSAAGNIITDPMYSQRASPFAWLGPRRCRQPAVRFDDLPPISTVLLSHNHYDHCDLATLRKLARRFDPLVVTPLGNGRLMRSAGIRRVEELDWWQDTTTGGWGITVTPAFHFSARTPFDRNRALWGGFALCTAGVRMYFAGDTAYANFFIWISKRREASRCTSVRSTCRPKALTSRYAPWLRPAAHTTSRGRDSRCSMSANQRHSRNRTSNYRLFTLM
jgi:glyoxylase-like metal-dependent hydrolase (beta-lactamase superfamily II)